GDGVDGFGAVLPHQAGDLEVELAADRLLAEDQAGERGGDQEKRRQGEEGVVRQGCRQGARLVLHPAVERLPSQRDDGRWLEGHGEGLWHLAEKVGRRLEGRKAAGGAVLAGGWRTTGRVSSGGHARTDHGQGTHPLHLSVL